MLEAFKSLPDALEVLHVVGQLHETWVEDVALFLEHWNGGYPPPQYFDAVLSEVLDARPTRQSLDEFLQTDYLRRVA